MTQAATHHKHHLVNSRTANGTVAAAPDRAEVACTSAALPAASDAASALASVSFVACDITAERDAGKNSAALLGQAASLRTLASLRHTSSPSRRWQGPGQRPPRAPQPLLPTPPSPSVRRPTCRARAPMTMLNARTKKSRSEVSRCHACLLWCHQAGFA